MQYRINGRDDVEFAICGHLEIFEFVFQAVTLRTFVELGLAALAEMDDPTADVPVANAPAV